MIAPVQSKPRAGVTSAYRRGWAARPARRRIRLQSRPDLVGVGCRAFRLAQPVRLVWLGSAGACWVQTAPRLRLASDNRDKRSSPDRYLGVAGPRPIVHDPWAAGTQCANGQHASLI